MTKKSTFLFFLIILLFMAIGAASASDDNATDIIEESPDENPVAQADLNETSSDDAGSTTETNGNDASTTETSTSGSQSGSERSSFFGWFSCTFPARPIQRAPSRPSAALNVWLSRQVKP